MAKFTNAIGNCCCSTCEELSWDAGTESDWTNDGNWTADGTDWVTTDQDSLILLDHSFDGGVNHAIRWEWEVTGADGVWRCIFWREDANNYWALQVEVDYAPPVTDYTIFSWIQVSGGAETVIRRVAGTQDVTRQNSLRVTVCWDDDKLSAKLETFNGSLWSQVYVLGRSGVTIPTASTTIGFHAVSFDQDETRLASIEDTCETCATPCPCSDGYGPAQYQVVVSGFTGGCAVWNGTYILDANWLDDGHIGNCRWEATYGSDPGDPYAKFVYLFVASSSVILQLYHTVTEYMYWLKYGATNCDGTLMSAVAVTGGWGTSCTSQSGTATVTPV